MSDDLDLIVHTGDRARKTLAEREAVIESRLQTIEDLEDQADRAFIDISIELLGIHNEKAYLERPNCNSFWDYCWQRWKWKRRQANYMFNGAGVVANLIPGTIVPTVLSPTLLPENEAQVRPLTRLSSVQDQKDAWELAVQRAAPDQPTQRDVDDVVRTEFEGLPTKAQAAAERRAREAEEREREVQERAEQLAREKREAEQRAVQAVRERRDAEERAEQLLRERDEIQMNRYMRFRKLIDAVRNVAEFHFESAAEIWDGISNARGSDDFMEYLDNAQRCLTRLKLEHPNAVRKPGIVVQRPG